MNTLQAFEVIHKLQEGCDPDFEHRTWNEATWYFKRDHINRLKELCE